MTRLIAANDIADYYGLNQKTYRQALRDQAPHDQRLSWHAHNARWVVEEGTPAFVAMIEVAKRLAGVSQNYAAAVGIAADQGNAKAQHDLGLMYVNGQGVPQNDAEAVKWFGLAADQGHAEAQHDLGHMYADGEGVPQNYAERNVPVAVEIGRQASIASGH